MAGWILIMLALPLAAACAGAVVGDRPVSGWLSVAAAAGSFAAALVVVFGEDAVRARHALGSAFFVDALSGVFLIAVAFCTRWSLFIRRGTCSRESATFGYGAGTGRCSTCSGLPCSRRP